MTWEDWKIFWTVVWVLLALFIVVQIWRTFR